MKTMNLEVIVMDAKHICKKDAKVTLVSLEKGAKIPRLNLAFNLMCLSYPGTGVPTGRYRLEVEANGMESQQREIQVGKNRSTEMVVLGKEGLPFYYRGQTKVPFEPPKNKFGISFFAREKGMKKFTEIRRQLPIETAPERGPIWEDNVLIFSFKEEVGTDERQKVLEQLNDQNYIRVAGPVLHYEDEKATFLTPQLIVRFEPRVKKDEVPAFSDKYDLKIIRTLPYAGNAYLFQAKVKPGFELLEIMEKIKNDDIVIYVEPNLVSTSEDEDIEPDDFLFSEQWGLELVKLPAAWETLRNENLVGINPGDPGDLTFGSENVVVAVMDRGIQSQTVGGVTTAAHPDFNGDVTGGATKVSQFYDFMSMQPNNDTPPNNHGMGCATGVGTLQGNPSTMPGTIEGGVGAAPNCRLMGCIRPAGGTDVNYADAYVWMAGFDPGWTVDGLNYPVGTVFPALPTPRVDIVTNSYGQPAIVAAVMADMVNFVTTYGRGGKGMLIFWSAGNSTGNPAVTKGIAYLPEVLCTGASTLDNDGTTEILSSYSMTGNAVEFVTPSHSEYVGSRTFHNPDDFLAVTAADLLGEGNMTGFPRDVTALSAQVNAGAFTQLTADGAVGDTVLSVGSTAGFVIGQQIRLGAHGNPSSQWLTINNIDAAANQLTTTPVGGATFRSGTPIFGPVTLQVGDSTACAVDDWIHLGNPGDDGFETVMIADIPDDHSLVANEVLFDHLNGTPATIGPNNYRNSFGGTSFSAPFAAGIAALVMSMAPALTWVEIRQILRDTAAKIDPLNTGAGIWTDSAGNPSTDPAYTTPLYSQWYGYGRLDAEAAVTTARDYPFSRDILIRDHTADDGTVPSSDPTTDVFYRSCDLWVRNTNPATDIGALPAGYGGNPPHQNPDSASDNWIYARFKNIGTDTSLDFKIRVYLTHFPGFEFTYPESFIPSLNPGDPLPVPLVRGTYLLGETTYSGLNPDTDDFLTFHWPEANIPPEEVMVDGVMVRWHPCLLAEITPHDGPEPSGTHVWDNNNLAQRNLSIIYPDDLGDEDFEIAAVMGNKNEKRKLMYLGIKRNKLPETVKLFVYFPDQKIMEMIQSGAYYEFGNYKGKKVIWLKAKEEVLIKLNITGQQLIPVIAGGVKAENQKGRFEVELRQYDEAQKVTGSIGMELRLGEKP